jgi:hypothetical protein
MKYLIQSSWLPLRLVLDLTKHRSCLSSIRSRMDQRSIVLDLHLKGLSAHAIHDDLMVTLVPEAVTYSRVTRYLCEAKLGTAEVTLDLEPSSYHLTWKIPTGPSWQPWTKSRLCPCENLPELPISHKLSSIEGSPNRSGSYDVFFAWCRTFSQTLTR